MNKEEIKITRKDYQACLRYIAKYWKQVTTLHLHDQYVHIGLPHRFVSPNHEIFKNDQFYWDSYFTILGLVSEGQIELAKGIVDNFVYLQQRFNIIPMRNRYYNLGVSQIPFLTSMVREIYGVTEDSRWAARAMKAAEKELDGYWMNRSLTEVHLVHRGLSRYCDHYITHLGAEHESGWDMTSRFHNKCLNYLPIDLNSALYRYEIDLAEFYWNTGHRKKANAYILRSEKRRRTMTRLMWNFEKGFFFDYDYEHKRQSTFYSIAGYYPLWAKLATHTQAEKLVKNLRLFEYDGGLANSQSSRLDKEFKQHDYPNGWPPQQWIVIRGLLNYGYNEDAKRLAKKYLDLNNKIFNRTKMLWEKYDVVHSKTGKADRYRTQSGFAWTNAIFLRLLDLFATP
jgi:alpha,alpha-trehalase